MFVIDTNVASEPVKPAPNTEQLLLTTVSKPTLHCNDQTVLSGTAD